MQKLSSSIVQCSSRFEKVTRQTISFIVTCSCSGNVKLSDPFRNHVQLRSSRTSTAILTLVSSLQQIAAMCHRLSSVHDAPRYVPPAEWNFSTSRWAFRASCVPSYFAFLNGAHSYIVVENSREEKKHFRRPFSSFVKLWFFCVRIIIEIYIFDK